MCLPRHGVGERRGGGSACRLVCDGQRAPADRRGPVRDSQWLGGEDRADGARDPGPAEEASQGLSLSAGAAFLPPASPGSSPRTSPKRPARRKRPGSSDIGGVAGGSALESTRSGGGGGRSESAQPQQRSRLGPSDDHQTLSSSSLATLAAAQSATTFDEGGTDSHPANSGDAISERRGADLSNDTTGRVLPADGVAPLSMSMISTASNASNSSGGPVSVVDDIVSSSDGSSQSPGSPLFMRMSGVDSLLANADELITDARTMFSSHNTAVVEKYRRRSGGGGSSDAHAAEGSTRGTGSNNSAGGFWAGLSASITSNASNISGQSSGSKSGSFLGFGGRTSRSSSGLSRMSGSTGPILDLDAGAPNSASSSSSPSSPSHPENPYFDRVLTLGSGNDGGFEVGELDARSKHGNGDNQNGNGDLLGMDEPQPGLSASSFPPQQIPRYAHATEHNHHLAETLGGPMASTDAARHSHMPPPGAEGGTGLLGVSIVMTNASSAKQDPSSDFRLLCDYGSASQNGGGLLDDVAAATAAGVAAVAGIAKVGVGAKADGRGSRGGSGKDSHGIKDLESEKVSSGTLLHGQDIGTLGGRPCISLESRLRQDVPAQIVENLIQTLLLSKGMVVSTQEKSPEGDTITMRATQQVGKGHCVTVLFGVSDVSKYRVVCVTVHGTDGAIKSYGAPSVASRAPSAVVGIGPDSSGNHGALQGNRPRGSSSFSDTFNDAIGGIVQGASNVFDGVVGLLSRNRIKEPGWHKVDPCRRWHCDSVGTPWWTSKF